MVVKSQSIAKSQSAVKSHPGGDGFAKNHNFVIRLVKPHVAQRAGGISYNTGGVYWAEFVISYLLLLKSFDSVVPGHAEKSHLSVRIGP